MYSIIRRVSKLKPTPPIVLAIIFAVSSVARFPCDDFRLSMLLLFNIAVALGLSVFVWRYNKWVAMFLMLTTISMVYPFYTRYSYLSFSAVLFGVIWYVLFVEFFTVAKLDIAYNTICIIALANILWLVLQHFNADPLFVAKGGLAHDVPVGLMGNRNLASALLAFCFPAFLRKRWCWFIPLLLFGLVRTTSLGGALAVAIGICVFFMLHGYKHFIILSAVVGFAIYNLCVDEGLGRSMFARYTAWEYALSLYKEHWLMGSGIGHWTILGHLKTDGLYKHWWPALHNDFLQALFEMGIGAAVIIGGYFVNIIKRTRKKARYTILPLTACVIISINSFVNFPFHIATTAIIGITWLAILEISLRKAHAIEV